MISDDEPSVAPQTPLPVWAAEAVKVPAEGYSAPNASLGASPAFVDMPEVVDAPVEPEPAPSSDAHNMNWADAQACLRRGQKVRRNEWGAEADWLEADFDGAVMIKRRGALWPYPQPIWDTGATDWQVVG